MTRLVAATVLAAAALAAPAHAAYREVTNPVDGCRHQVWTPMLDVRDGRVVVVGEFDYESSCR